MAKAASSQKHEEFIQPSAADTYLDSKGREKPDPTPIAPPIGYKRQPSLAEQIRNMVRSERLAMEAAAAGYGTFEEEDDFDTGEDLDPRSPYEIDFDPPLQTISPPQQEGGSSPAVPPPVDTPSPNPSA
ncbi:hypothetical protein [Apis mellifera associated microvirus 42]|nr:hypothetical protein [Apis mellifera associated microvirus 42]